MESSTFLHDRQTCVMVMSGSFMGNVLWSVLHAKKRGMRMKMSFVVGLWAAKSTRGSGVLTTLSFPAWF